MSRFAEKVRAWYQAGIWTLEMVENAVRKGKISEAEFFEITGEDYMS